MSNPNPKPSTSTLWKKGQPSPNPGGRLRGVRDMAEEAVAEAAKVGREDALRRILQEFAKIAFDKKIHIKLRLDALHELADRGLGKPVTPTLNLNAEISNGILAQQLADPAKREQLAQLTEQFSDLLGNAGTPRDVR